MKLRLQKAPEEQNTIQKTIDITGETFLDLLKFVKPGVYEYQVEAEMLNGFFKRGAQDYAYLPIVASGKNTIFYITIQTEIFAKKGTYYY